MDTINSYGINNNSNNKEFCFEFMKFLLSKEMQEKASLDALSINKLAAETKANYMIKNVVVWRSMAIHSQFLMMN